MRASLKERVRSTLLRAALELSARHGFSSLGLREVSRAANIAPTSFYRHFADMHELGKALVEELVEPVLGALTEGVQPGESDNTAQALARQVMDTIEQEPELVRFMLSERVGAFAELRRELTRRLEQLAAKLGTQVGRDAADVILALMLDMLGRALDATPSDRVELRERVVAAIGLVLRARRP